ncbi:hypothetical protein EG328_007163 [Venturia inaequalis]|uniref:Multicopper oxidase n=1 Tax=Venturia inaequalis TaxID=5025 RepID=A0A8H3YT03_VENIN|nr:hypothetical protein EG328_007163 [Venturia inaequalis]
MLKGTSVEWGSLNAPPFPPFLTTKKSHNAGKAPWGGLDNSLQAPERPFRTGVTRYYDFVISRAKIAPDGYVKGSILVNSQFPGPPLEANWGDEIVIKIFNNITAPAEGTSIHFHGIRNQGTPWYDGVPGVSQCPIAPGATFTYRFLADAYGTTWYHSHYAAQYTAGVFGPLIIYGPKHQPYDIDVGPIMIGDHYHSDYVDVVKNVTARTNDFNTYVPKSDNSLINGMNPFNCSLDVFGGICGSNAPTAKFRFKRGKTHRLRLINVGAAAFVKFSIDEHKLQVISNDLVPLEPYEVDFVPLSVGQRVDVLISARNNTNNALWMRSTISMNCSAARMQDARAVVLYDNANEEAIPHSVQSAAVIEANDKLTLCKNDDLKKTVPYFPVPVVAEPDTTLHVLVNLTANNTRTQVWSLNNRTQFTNYNQPLLLQVNRKNFSFPDPSANMYNFGVNRTIRIVMNTVYQSGHKFYPRAQELGTGAQSSAPTIH